MRNFQFVDVDDLTEKELIDILNFNGEVCSEKKHEIDRLKEGMTSFISSDISNGENYSKKNIEISDDGDEDFELEVDYYLNDLSSADKDELKNNINSILPNHNSGNYVRIVLRLMAELTREIKEINEFVLGEKQIDKSEREEFIEEIESLKEKRELLRTALSQQESEIESGKRIDNKLIFIPTSLGNPRVLNEMKDIPQEYYPDFLELFNSIKDGTFKDVKRFINNLTLKGAAEVRGFKIRVVFVRLSDDSFGLLTAFVKKTDNDRGYRIPIELKMKEFRAIRQSLVDKLNDEQFLLQNKETEEELFSLLGQNLEAGEGEVFDDKTRIGR